jgi:hypothetical protein
LNKVLKNYIMKKPSASKNYLVFNRHYDIDFSYVTLFSHFKHSTYCTDKQTETQTNQFVKYDMACK